MDMSGNVGGMDMSRNMEKKNEDEMGAVESTPVVATEGYRGGRRRR
jgi:hypothetical protein